ncbi:MAG TPA: EamA family transporter [Rectinemataceae bacterium]
MNIIVILSGIAFSAGAQVFMKLASRFKAFSPGNLAWLACAALSYALSFAAYAALLRRMDLSKISPLMTVAVSLCAVLAGTLAFGEQWTVRKAAGLALGIASVLLLAP